MGELSKVQERESMPAQQQETAAIMSMIERVAMSPDADINKLEKMFEMQQKAMDRNAKQSFTADLAAMQESLPRVIEHGEGHNKAKFAKLEDINDAIRPVLHRYGFAVTFRIKHESNLVWITTVLSHKGGHSEETAIPLAVDSTGSKNPVQAVGSSISYGKRYGICAMLNISTGDDVDGGLPTNVPQNLPDITDALQSIKDAATMEDLHGAFKEAWEHYLDKTLRAKLTTAKDDKKKELIRG